MARRFHDLADDATASQRTVRLVGKNELRAASPGKSGAWPWAAAENWIVAMADPLTFVGHDECFTSEPWKGREGWGHDTVIGFWPVSGYGEAETEPTALERWPHLALLGPLLDKCPLVHGAWLRLDGTVVITFAEHDDQVYEAVNAALEDVAKTFPDAYVEWQGMAHQDRSPETYAPSRGVVLVKPRL